MSLHRKIPLIQDSVAPYPADAENAKENSKYSFLKEVDFKKLSALLESRSLVPRPTVSGNSDVNSLVISAEEKPELPLGHLVGTQESLDQLLSILSSSRVNNAIISGPEGIGKTTLMEALLRARADNRLTSQLTRPYFVFDANEFALNSYGQNGVDMFDKALTVAASRNGIVLIDHFDDFLQTAAPASARVLASTLLKHVENDKNLQAVIACSPEGKKIIEETSNGFSGLFQTVEMSKEPNDAQLKKILIAHFAGLEMAHNVSFSEEVADQVISLMNRYPEASGRVFKGARPQNALMLADKVATYVRLNKYAEPVEMTERREEIRLLQDQLGIIVTDGEPAEVKRQRLQQQIDELITQYREIDRKWKEKFEPLFKARQQLEEMDTELTGIRNKKDSERTPREKSLYDSYWGKRDGTTGMNKYETQKAKVAALEKSLYPQPPQVDPKHVTLVFSRATGIPLSTLSSGVLKRLAELPKFMDDRIFEAEEGKKAAIAAFRGRELGVRSARRAAAVIIFSGPTGSGKTEIVRQLAKFAAGEETAKPTEMRLSEFGDDSAPAKLMGAAPGLVGFDEGSPFLDPVKKNGKTIVLFDEADKGHKKVFDLLMQVFDDGGIANSKGEYVSFKDTIIFINMNALLPEDVPEDKRNDLEELKKVLLQKAVNDKGEPLFRKEILSRVDFVVLFPNLSKDAATKILKKEVGEINKDFSSRDLSMSMSDETATALINRYHVPSENGRSPRAISTNHIRPVLESYLEKRLNELGDESDGMLHERVRIEFDGQHVTVHPESPTTPMNTHTAAVPTATLHH